MPINHWLVFFSFLYSDDFVEENPMFASQVQCPITQELVVSIKNVDWHNALLQE